MNLPKDPHHNRPEKDGCPYQDLYIYYLQGRLKPAAEMFRDNFIGNWEEENYSFLFFSSPAQREIEDLLRTQTQLTYLDSFQMSYDQWQSEKFTALHHGQFCILPAWEALPDQDSNQDSHLGSSQGSESDKKIILLDPGVVFGNGTHPTTGDCLDALELAFATKPPETVLDLGTGTGLLALAAARLGGKKILAVDLNPLAVKTAQNNVRLNELAAAVLVAQGRAENCIDFTADLVIANIHYDVMRELVRTKGFLLKRRFILSGLLRSEAKVLSEILAKLPVKVQKMWTHDGIWHTFYGGTTNAST
jgi:ribosomal protein L11 methyltransferase